MEIFVLTDRLIGPTSGLRDPITRCIARRCLASERSWTGSINKLDGKRRTEESYYSRTVLSVLVVDIGRTLDGSTIDAVGVIRAGQD